MTIDRRVTAQDQDSYPQGPSGIDEVRVLDALLRLEEVAREIGWSTVLRVLADLTRQRGH